MQTDLSKIVKNSEES